MESPGPSVFSKTPPKSRQKLRRAVFPLSKVCGRTSDILFRAGCSCHGKCDCDPEGGALKESADDYEGNGSELSDRRKTIRSARELAQFGRENDEALKSLAPPSVPVFMVYGMI